MEGYIDLPDLEDLDEHPRYDFAGNVSETTSIPPQLINDNEAYFFDHIQGIADPLMQSHQPILQQQNMHSFRPGEQQSHPYGPAQQYGQPHGAVQQQQDSQQYGPAQQYGQQHGHFQQFPVQREQLALPTQFPPIVQAPPRDTPQSSSSARVPIPALTPVRNGPASRQYIVPPKPKPGRKSHKSTTEDDDEEGKDPKGEGKRKKQNRDAQARFRDSRKTKFDAMVEALAETTKTHQEQTGQWMGNIAELRSENEKLRAQNASLCTQMQQMQMQINNGKENEGLGPRNDSMVQGW